MFIANNLSQSIPRSAVSHSFIHSSLGESPARPRVDSRPRLLPPTFTHLPKLGTDLVTTLPRLNVNDFSASRSRASPLPVSHPHRNQSSNTNARHFDFFATKIKRARLFDCPPSARSRAPPRFATARIIIVDAHLIVYSSFLVSSFARRVASFASSVVCTRPSHSVDLSPKMDARLFSSIQKKKTTLCTRPHIVTRRPDGRTDGRTTRANGSNRSGTCPRVSILYPRASCPV